MAYRILQAICFFIKNYPRVMGLADNKVDVYKRQALILTHQVLPCLQKVLQFVERDMYTKF